MQKQILAFLLIKLESVRKSTSRDYIKSWGLSESQICLLKHKYSVKGNTLHVLVRSTWSAGEGHTQKRKDKRMQRVMKGAKGTLSQSTTPPWASPNWHCLVSFTIWPKSAPVAATHHWQPGLVLPCSNFCWSKQVRILKLWIHR